MPEKIPLSSSLNYKPTPRQLKAIAELSTSLGTPVPAASYPKTRLKARNLIYKLKNQLKEDDNEDRV